MMLTMKIVLDPGATMPERAHETDAGLDLRCTRNAWILPFGGSRVFDTGVHIQLPHGTYGKIESKSGLNVKNSVVSCGGVIDEGYTGSIRVKLYNFGFLPKRFKAGEKIAQLIVQPYLAPWLEWSEALDASERGDNGFGSTGK